MLDSLKSHLLTSRTQEKARQKKRQATVLISSLVAGNVESVAIFHGANSGVISIITLHLMVELVLAIRV